MRTGVFVAFPLQKRLEPSALPAGVSLFVIFGPLSLSLAGSRLLSKIPIGPVYLYDVAIAAAVLVTVFYLSRFPSTSLSKSEAIGLSVVLLLPIWAMAKFLMSDFSRDALRELHPFLYLSYAVIVALVFRRASQKIARFGKQVVFFSLLVFWLWTTLRLIGFYLEWGPRSASGSWLEITGDADGWILGLLASLMLIFSQNRGTAPRVAAYIAIVVIHVQIALLGSRSAQLAAALMIVVALALMMERKQQGASSPKSKKNIAAIASVTVLALILPFALTPIGAKYLGALSYLSERYIVVDSPEEEVDSTSGPGVDQQSLAMNRERPELVSVGRGNDPYTVGEGTVRARLNSWEKLTSWLFEEPKRVVVGVGLGTDYFWDSGARDALVGEGPRVEGENRWPHNFFLTTLALLGLPAALILLLVLFGAVITLYRARMIPTGSVSDIALLILVGVSTVSFFGVVFENPFGSLPTAWVIGVAISQLSSAQRVGSK